jgi:F-type H+-transporting ATPase subunit c
MDPVSLKFLAIGLMCFAMLGAAIGVGMIFAAVLNGVARNPATEGKLFKYAIIGAGMAEAMGIFGVGLALLMLFAV